MRERWRLVGGQLTNRGDRGFDRTDDRLDAAVLALAEAEALTALDADGASVAVDIAESQLGELGLEASGWRTAFALALDRVPSATA